MLHRYRNIMIMQYPMCCSQTIISLMSKVDQLARACEVSEKLVWFNQFYPPPPLLKKTLLKKTLQTWQHFEVTEASTGTPHVVHCSGLGSIDISCLRSQFADGRAREFRQTVGGQDSRLHPVVRSGIVPRSQHRGTP